MNGKRLKLFRLARGLSLDGLALRMGGIVSKQAISKYERCLSQPSPRVVTKLAKALDVKASSLWGEAEISVSFIAYRRGYGLNKKNQTRIESFVTETLENWTSLQELIGGNRRVEIPVQSERIENLEATESAAAKIRQRWNLGVGPIANVTSMLEEHNVFVIPIDENGKFDGISAIVKDEDQQVKAAAVASRRDIPGERQRLNLVHELGHLVLKVQSRTDEEKAAFRFGAALLAPRESIYNEVGEKRSTITLEELMILKKTFGLSLQALVTRLKDLDIISQTCATGWFIHINQRGWKRKEPDELEAEQPQWLRKSVFRALVERVITVERAEQLLGEKVGYRPDASLATKRAFMKLPAQARNNILSKQAKRSTLYYNENRDWEEMQEIDS